MLVATKISTLFGLLILLSKSRLTKLDESANEGASGADVFLTPTENSAPLISILFVTTPNSTFISLLAEEKLTELAKNISKPPAMTFTE